MDKVTFAILNKKINSITEDVDQIATEATEAWLEDNIDPSTGYVLDNTLTLDNAAPPASAVGDLKSAFGEIAEGVTGDNIENPATDTINTWIGTSGNADTLNTYSTSDFIEIEEGKTYAVGVYDYATKKIVQTRTLYAFYDSGKAFISGTRGNVDNTKGLVATAPTGAKYMRASGHTGAANNNWHSLMVVESNSVPDYYIPYSFRYVITADVPALDDLMPLAGTTEYVDGENLYNSETSIAGFLYYNGNITDSPSGTYYSVSDLIPVKPNTNYYVVRYNNSLTSKQAARIIAACYTEHGFFAADTYINTDNVESIVINSGEYSFIRVCSQAEMIPTPAYLMVSEGAMPDMYYGYAGKTFTTLSVKPDNSPSFNALYGKKWAVCGDSFTNSGGTGTLLTSGLYKGRAFTYPWIIGNRNNMKIEQFFAGGKTLAFPATPGDFTNSLTCQTEDSYYQNIPLDSDYITIMLGINDEHHATGGGDGEDPTGYIPLGEITDETTASYYGAWNVVLTWLITNRPNAHIGIIVTNGLSIEGYRTAQIEIAKKYGIPYIDLNGDERTPAMLRTINPNIPIAIKQALIAKWAVDPTGASGEVNTHPNDDAQLFESTFIENFLRSI